MPLTKRTKKYRKVFLLLFLVNVFLSVTILKSLTKSNKQMNGDNIKFILFWSPAHSEPFNVFAESPVYNCPVSNNCYFTNNRHYFGGELENFDAILFNAKEGESWFRNNFPEQRFPHQKYVFVSSESAVNYPICTNMFDNFFNWTWTYKLDSDCPLRYFTITNKNGDLVGPQTHMDWIDANSVNFRFGKDLQSKRKAVAWFVSNCVTRSNRRKNVIKLQKALHKYNLTVDIYGACGKLRCGLRKVCDQMLKREYYFYMALENSICEDYVTEKVYRAVQHNVVPIVLNGARHERFLPPNSYLEIKKQNKSVKQNYKNIAETMNNLIKNPDLYSNYFKWTQNYEYVDNGFDVSVCDFCKLLNNKNKTRTFSVYKDIRSWWNPDYTKWCDYD